MPDISVSHRDGKAEGDIWGGGCVSTQPLRTLDLRLLGVWGGGAGVTLHEKAKIRRDNYCCMARI